MKTIADTLLELDSLPSLRRGLCPGVLPSLRKFFGLGCVLRFCRVFAESLPGCFAACASTEALLGVPAVAPLCIPNEETRTRREWQPARTSHFDFRSLISPVPPLNRSATHEEALSKVKTTPCGIDPCRIVCDLRSFHLFRSRKDYTYIVLRSGVTGIFCHASRGTRHSGTGPRDS